MRKILPITKSFLILALAVLTVFQINQLWLVNLTNRNFLIYLQARFATAAPDGQSVFSTPYRVISGVGDGLFRMMYSGIAQSDEWLFGETALQTVLHSGVFEAKNSRIDLQASPVLIYEYAFPMCAEKFSQALGYRKIKLLKDSGIENFNSVAVFPSGDTSCRVVFMDAQNTWEFSVQLDSSYDFSSDSPLNLYYVKTNDGFVPQADISGFSYDAIIAENPFRNTQGLLTSSHIRGMVEPFFDNPASVIAGTSGIYTFSTRNSMVRYLENSVLEYTSYRTIGRTASDSFMADFSAALDFVKKDTNVINEIYLRKHEQLGRENVFWFDYVINNHPIVLVQEWYTGGRCTDPLIAPIEVVVDHGRVVRYRRIVYTFTSGGLAWKDLSPSDRNYTMGYPIFPEQRSGVIELAEVY